MKTDKIMVYSDGSGTEKAMQEAEKFAVYNELDAEEGLLLRLLTEEMLGMIKGIAGGFEGDFWLESKQDEYRICLRADTYMDKQKKKELLALSASGKNESSVGIMQMIKNIIVNGLKDMDDVSDLQNVYDDGPVMYGTMGLRDASGVSTTDFEWSLLQYRSMVEQEKEKSRAKEAWDELEKSIVANIADDVRVGVRGDIVEMTIIKRFAKKA